MKKSVQQYLKYLVVVAIIIFALIGVPILIHLFFKNQQLNPFFVTEWSAGEVLAYYGAILAAVGSAVGVFLTVRYSQKNYEEDMRKRVLPVITITELMTRSHYDPLQEIFSGRRDMSSVTENENSADSDYAVYEEYHLESVYFIYEEDSFTPKPDLPKKYQDILKRCGHEWKILKKDEEALKQVNYFSFPLEIENVGNGTAINLRIGLIEKDKEGKYVRAIQLNPGKIFYIHIYVPEIKEVDTKLFLLNFTYSDIYHNSYSQVFPLEFEGEYYNWDYAINQVLEKKNNG